MFVDFQLVYDNLRTGQTKITDTSIMERILNSRNLSDYLGEGVYLRFDGVKIPNERNFENGCTDMPIPPQELRVCLLKRKSDNSVIFSRFEIIKYMMAKTRPECIKYYGAVYTGAPDFTSATDRIQEKVKKYYRDHSSEISQYDNDEYLLDFKQIHDLAMEGLPGKTEIS